MKLQSFRNPPGLGRWEGFVQRCRAVGVQVVQDHSDYGYLGVRFIHQPAHLVGEVLHGAPLRNRHVPPAGQGLTGQEQVAGARPAVLVVLPPWSLWLGRQRGTGVTSNWVEVSSKQTTGRWGS